MKTQNALVFKEDKMSTNPPEEPKVIPFKKKNKKTLNDTNNNIEHITLEEYLNVISSQLQYLRVLDEIKEKQILLLKDRMKGIEKCFLVLLSFIIIISGILKIVSIVLEKS